MQSGCISIDRITDEDRWQSLFQKAGQKYMTQAWAFGEARRATNWTPVRLAFARENETVAICQVLTKTFCGVPLAARINLGPLFLEGHADQALDIFRAIRRHWRLPRRGMLFMAPALPYAPENLQHLRSIGFRPRSNYRWESSRLDLTADESVLRKSLLPKWRNQLRKSERSDLRFVAANDFGDVSWIVERSAEDATEKGFRGPGSKFLLHLFKASPDDFKVYRAEHEGRPVAGIVAFKFQDAAHYYVGWNGPEGRRLNAGNFLLWNAALHLKQQGCDQFDLGGHGAKGSSGISDFKLGMNGRSYQLLGEFICL